MTAPRGLLAALKRDDLRRSAVGGHVGAEGGGKGKDALGVGHSRISLASSLIASLLPMLCSRAYNPITSTGFGKQPA